MSWSPSNPPIRGGSYSRFIARRQETLPASTRGTVALAISHDWGPADEFVPVTSIADFVRIFGQGGDPATNTYTPGFLAAYNAFKGENEDYPGAGRLVVYRKGGTGLLAASKSLQNTTPAAAITVTAVYKGTRGNKLKVAVEANAKSPATKQDLVIYDGNTEVERYAHVKAEIDNLAADVNRRSDWVRVTVTINSVALALIAATALTGGNDGAAWVAQDWTDLSVALETQSFDVFVPYDLTDESIQTSLIAWAKDRNHAQKSKRFMAVFGGAGAEDMQDAIDGAFLANDENVVRVGVGTYRDTALNTVMSTSQIAPRVAGIIASRGYSAAISFAHLSDIEVVTGPSESDILDAIENGVVVLALDSAGVRIEQGITTYTDDTDEQPKSVYGQIKYAYTMQSFEKTLQLRHESGNVLGRLNVNDDTREYLIGDGQQLLNDVYIRDQAVQPGAKVVLASNPPPSDDQNFVALDWIASFARSLDQVRNTFYLS